MSESQTGPPAPATALDHGPPDPNIIVTDSHQTPTQRNKRRRHADDDGECERPTLSVFGTRARRDGRQTPSDSGSEAGSYTLKLVTKEGLDELLHYIKLGGDGYVAGGREWAHVVTWISEAVQDCLMYGRPEDGEELSHHRAARSAMSSALRIPSQAAKNDHMEEDSDPFSTSQDSPAGINSSMHAPKSPISPPTDDTYPIRRITRGCNRAPRDSCRAVPCRKAYGHF